jgi:hypothetical protein
LITSTERRDKHIQPPGPRRHRHRPGSLPTNADTAQPATTEHVATRDRSTIKPPKLALVRCLRQYISRTVSGCHRAASTHAVRRLCRMDPSRSRTASPLGVTRRVEPSR